MLLITFPGVKLEEALITTNIYQNTFYYPSYYH